VASLRINVRSASILPPRDPVGRNAVMLTGGTINITVRLSAGPWEFNSQRWLAEVQLLHDAGTIDSLTRPAERLVNA
jgi:hypothetical protein